MLLNALYCFTIFFPLIVIIKRNPRDLPKAVHNIDVNRPLFDHPDYRTAINFGSISHILIAVHSRPMCPTVHKAERRSQQHLKCSFYFHNIQYSVYYILMKLDYSYLKSMKFILGTVLNYLWFSWHQFEWCCDTVRTVLSLLQLMT